MRRVILGETGIESSALGFGASSLGSRATEAEGARALLAALDAGVTWIDLAPVYGAGLAETIVGRALRGRRDEAQICTKVGLRLAGGLKGRLRAAAMPVARRVMGRLGALQGAVRKAAPKANAKLPITGDLVRTSIEDSLRRLGADRIEVYALHGPSAAELRDEGVLRALEDVVAAGKARAVSVAGDAAAAADALTLPRGVFGVVQMPTPGPGAPDLVLPAARAAGFGAITHSIMGENLAALARRAAEDADFRARACEAGGEAEAEPALARLLMARAFARNPGGVVLVSMLSARSLARNVAAAATAPADPAGDGLAALGL